VDNWLFLLPQGTFLVWIPTRLREIGVMIINMGDNTGLFILRQGISFLRDEVSLTLVVCSKSRTQNCFVPKCRMCMAVLYCLASKSWGGLFRWGTPYLLPRCLVLQMLRYDMGMVSFRGHPEVYSYSSGLKY
jgi:hypothetical protein